MAAAENQPDEAESQMPGKEKAFFDDYIGGLAGKALGIGADDMIGGLAGKLIGKMQPRTISCSGRLQPAGERQPVRSVGGLLG